MGGTSPKPLAFQVLAPLFGYLLVSLAATWPLAVHLKGWVVAGFDWGQNFWALWWTRQSLVVLGQDPFFTRYLFHPEGVTLLFHPVDIADGLLMIPLYATFGGEVAYNVTVLLSYVLGGWGAYLLALRLTGHRGAAFVAGLVFTLSPYHFSRIYLGHLNLATIQWIPFYTLFLLRFVERGAWRAAFVAVFFLAFMALYSWYYVLYCGLLSGVVLLWPGQKSWPAIVGRVALVQGGAMLLLSPILLPMFQTLRTTEIVGAHNPLRHSVDLWSFWIPAPPSSWAGPFAEVWPAYSLPLYREPGGSAYLGYVTLALSMAGLLRSHRRVEVRWWLLVALCFTILALGPQAQIGGHPYGLPLPYGYLAELPGFSLAGVPGRFVVMVSLALAMLAAYGVTVLTERWPYLWLLAGLLVGLEYWAAPVPLERVEVADFYHTMAADRESYAIIEIKWDGNFLLYAQTIHGKPLIAGWLARLPAEQAAYLEQPSLDKSFLYTLLGPEGAALTDPTVIRPALQQALVERNVRYIIDHDNRAGPWLEQFIGWPVVHREGEMVVYGRE